MRKIEIEELKDLQINILDAVHKCCKKNNINYWLDCGTLLGAIRHKGYIPWDDDIDVGMLRSDYEKFRKIFNTENERYVFMCPEDNSDFCYPHGKVLDTWTLLYEPDRQGRKIAVNIDIFVYDNAPKNERILKRMYRMRDFYRGCNVARSQRKDYIPGIKRKIGFLLLKILLRPFPRNYFARKISDNSKKYANTITGRVGNFTSYSKFICESSVFESFVDCMFENKLYSVPKGYDKWLRAFYGDYMKLPPVEKRVSSHKFEAYMI